MIGKAELRRTARMMSMPLISGRPRSRMRRSGYSRATASTASAPSAASTTLYPCAARLARSRRRIAGSSSTTSTVGLLAMLRRLLGHGLGARGRKADGEHGAAAVAAVAGADGAAERFDEAAADGKAEPGAGALPVLGVDAIELVEDTLEVLLRHDLSFIHELDQVPAVVAARAEQHLQCYRRGFCGVLQHV